MVFDYIDYRFALVSDDTREVSLKLSSWSGWGQANKNVYKIQKNGCGGDVGRR